jgi:hypothetical protein
VIIAIALWVESAHAGALGQLVKSLKEKSGDGDGERASQDRPHRDDDRPSTDADSWHDRSDASGSGSDGVSTDDDLSDPAPVETYVAGPVGGRDADFRLDVGLHRVDDSDGAAYASLRASHGRLGFAISDVAYYEQTRMGAEVESVSLHVWTVGAAYRMNVADGALWLSAGLSGATSDGLQLYGAFAGGEVSLPLAGAFGLEGAGRWFLLQDDIQAVELRAGIHASFLHVGYRVMEFNVGPPLRGPEAGLALHF